MNPTHANISQVTPRLWIGGDLATQQPTLAAIQLREIADLGITSTDSFIRRAEDVMQFLPKLWETTEAILFANSGIVSE